MEPLFEAKATINQQLTSYNIYRINQEKYKAELMLTEDAEISADVPSELTLVRKDNKWCTDDNSNPGLAATLGTEIDVFNYGYGDLLGRIGVV
ncbi:MAG TPA: hypothetical protein VF623_12965 [Segetibacter sp.]